MGEHRGDPGAVIGVVIAGVLVSFAVSGPYAWDTTLLGALLLLVLIGYGQFPRTWREALGTAAAAAFAVLFLIGHLIDATIQRHGQAWLSQWPAPKKAPELDRISTGWHALLVWLGLVVLCLIALAVLDTDGGRRLRGRLDRPWGWKWT